MKIKKETLEKLDEINLNKFLSEVSVGNLMRGVLWTCDAAKKAKDYISDIVRQYEIKEDGEEEKSSEQRGKRKKK